MDMTMTGNGQYPIWLVVSTPLKNITVYCCLLPSHEAVARPHDPSCFELGLSRRHQGAHIMLSGNLAADL